jgi:hypothetical protein
MLDKVGHNVRRACTCALEALFHPGRCKAVLSTPILRRHEQPPDLLTDAVRLVIEQPGRWTGLRRRKRDSVKLDSSHGANDGLVCQLPVVGSSIRDDFLKNP